MKQSGSSGDLNNSSRATEGWLELFLTPTEKTNFSSWNEVVRDKSIVGAAGSSFFQWLARNRIPPNVSPNLITLTGLVMLVQAWYVCHGYGDLYPVGTTWLAVLNILLFFVTNSVTYYHADNIRQHTPLSDLFKYSCDSGSVVFLALLVSYCLGGNMDTQWYAVQAGQLVLFLKHLSAFKRHAGLRYRLVAGPGEVLVLCVALLAVRAVVGLEALQQIYQQTGRAIASNLTVATEQVVEAAKTKARSLKATVATETAGSHLVAMTDVFLLSASDVCQLLYYGLFAAAVVNSSMLPKEHGWTRFGLQLSLLMRFVPAILLHENMPVHSMDIICAGLFMSVLTTDLSLAKMAKRELHPMVILMSLAAVLSYSVILSLVAVYFIGVFADLSFYMNLPIFAVSRNVYCDGVYDLCHIGHKRAFQNALALGNRLFVGVVGDEDAKNYKRPPMMTGAERCAEVEGCKAVTKVIPNAPCFGITQDFLDEHQIHVVAFGEEYLERWPDPEDDKYYRIPRQLGIAQALPRTDGLSTSELIARIRNSEHVAKKSDT